LAEFLMNYFSEEIKKQIKNINEVPDDFFPLGCLVAGYDGDVGKTIIISIGKKSTKKEQLGSGCTIGGDLEVVNKLWELNRADQRRKAKYATFSLQDAVDYAEYLINTTSNFQRFANMIPTVGGYVDIGLITPFKPFTWIKCKDMTIILERGSKPQLIGGLYHEGNDV